MKTEISANISKNYATKEEFNKPLDEYGRKPDAVFCNYLNFFGIGHANN